MKINAFCIDNISKAKDSCDRLIACVSEQKKIDGVDYFIPYKIGLTSGNIYLDGLLDDNVLENACDYLFNSGASAIVRAAYDLNETGLIEAKYKLSSIMLLHKLGIIDKCTIVGGVCLDNDDLDLMAQENIPLVLLPTADAGYGHGYAPVCAALRRGIRVGIGTYDGKYNQSADLDYEIKFLSLTANAEMRTENALSKNEIKKIFAFE